MYQIYVGNPYETFKEGDVICTTTNGETKKDGKAVMGRGNAQFVRDTFKGVDTLLGQLLKKYGNRVVPLGKHTLHGKSFTLLTFPTKNAWRDKSDLALIEKSAREIKQLADHYGFKTIYIPIPGCANGQLKWSQVKGVLGELDERFIIYSLNEKDFEY